jgi:tripartite-type tricarboxylate transporter receptor subunit TctC
MAISRNRRQLFLGVAAALATHSRRASADSRAAVTRILCGYPAGGSVDMISRRVADKLRSQLGGSVLVENRPGAAGRLAVDELKRAASDVSTLLATPASVLTMYPHTYQHVSYDVFTDLAPISIVALTAFALVVGPKVPPTGRAFDDFVRWCKAHPSEAQIGNPGAGSMPHFMAMQIARETGVTFVHVPYRGGGPAFQDAAAGQIAAALATEGSAQALMASGRLRVLATSSDSRSVCFPDAPTFREIGMNGLTRQEWYGLFAKAGASGEQVSDIGVALRASLAGPDVVTAWAQLGLSVATSTAAELRSMLRTEYSYWASVVRSTGFTPEA